MRISLGLPHAGQASPSASLIAFTQRAEQLGFEAVLCGDHLVLPTVDQHDYPYTADGSFARPTTTPFNESMSVLAYLAATTTTIGLGTTVMVLPYRNPIIAAKMWATLDVLSHGRAICGIGVGWSKKEFEVLGVRYEERGAITDEYLEAMRLLWEDDRPKFKGKYVTFDGIAFLPKPIQRPLPIWIGGHSRAAARRAGRFGQSWHVARMEPEYVASLIPEVRKAATRAGRDASSVRISLKRRLHFTDLDVSGGPSLYVADGVSGTTDEVIADALHCRQLGITDLAFDFRTSDIEEQIAVMERIASRVMPAVADRPSA